MSTQRKLVNRIQEKAIKVSTYLPHYFLPFLQYFLQFSDTADTLLVFDMSDMLSVLGLQYTVQ